jgi:hypothetical protein
MFAAFVHRFCTPADIFEHIWERVRSQRSSDFSSHEHIKSKLDDVRIFARLSLRTRRSNPNRNVDSVSLARLAFFVQRCVAMSRGVLGFVLDRAYS